MLYGEAIRVFCICPGYVRTPMISLEQVDNQKQNKESRILYHLLTESNRKGLEPKEVSDEVIHSLFSVSRGRVITINKITLNILFRWIEAFLPTTISDWIYLTYLRKLDHQIT